MSQPSAPPNGTGFPWSGLPPPRDSAGWFAHETVLMKLHDSFRRGPTDPVCAQMGTTSALKEYLTMLVAATPAETSRRLLAQVLSEWLSAPHCAGVTQPHRVYDHLKDVITNSKSRPSSRQYSSLSILTSRSALMCLSVLLDQCGVLLGSALKDCVEILAKQARANEVIPSERLIY